MFNLRQRIVFKIVALGIIFAFLPTEICFARGRGNCKLGQEIATGVAMSVLPSVMGAGTQNVTFNQVIMGNVVAPGISTGLAHAGLDDPIGNAAASGLICGGIQGGLLNGKGFDPNGALTGGAQWAVTGATSNYLEQQGVHPALAGLGGTVTGQFAAGAMQGMLYKNPYDANGEINKEWGDKYRTYEMVSKDGTRMGTLSREDAERIGINEWQGVTLEQKQTYGATPISEADLSKYDRAFKVVETHSLTPTKSMGRGFFEGGWQAVTEPGLSYYAGETLRAGILQAGYNRNTGETETWAKLTAPFVGDGARGLAIDIKKKQSDSISDSIPDPTPWYGHAISGLTRAAVSEGITHITKKNDLLPQTTGLLANLATGAVGGAIQSGFRQDDVSLGESVRQGIARSQYLAYKDVLTFGSSEQRFRGTNHGLESSLYAGRVLDFAQSTWLRKVKKADGSTETKVGLYYGDALRNRMANISISQAANNIAIPVRQTFIDQFAIEEGNYAERFEEFVADPRVPQNLKDKFISEATINREQYEKLGKQDWEQKVSLSYKQTISDISKASFGEATTNWDYKLHHIEQSESQSE